jgi:biopolymer transport protein ExbD
LGEVEGDLQRLDALSDRGPQGRVVRLDRLLDLFDAARFGEDEYARETFWEALGGHQVGVGDEATREAIRRLLDEALALEAKPTQADETDFVADAIHLLTNDMQQPATAEDVSIRNLAYRELVDNGHGRVADNARWRLYDHARGTLVGATQSSPDDRIDVAVQALYTAHESVADLLADTSAHGRPVPPRPDELWALVGVHRVALAKDPRWKDVIAVRDADDNALRQTLLSMLPAPRDPAWKMPTLPRGTASGESLAPVVEVYAGKAVVDAGRPGSRSVLLRDEVEELARAIQSAISQDGRAAVLLAADPMLPAPDLFVVLRALRRAQVSSLELAVKEPRLTGEGDVVVALPVFVARSSDATPGVRSLLQARIAVHATGHGPIVFVDGRGLETVATGPRELAAQLDAVESAYPRERIVRLTVANDVQYGQLVDLVAALVGGPEPRFGRVGWWAGGGPDKGEQARANDGLLALRASLSRPQPKVDLDQPYPLKDDDQKRLEAFAASLAACMPELEDKRARAGMRVELRFGEGTMQSAALLRPKPRRGFPGEPFSDCVDEQAFGLRLRHHQDKFAVKVSIE